MISTANPELRSLDIRECANIDLNKALKEIENLKKLECLKIGPSKMRVDPDEFLQVTNPYLKLLSMNTNK